MQLSKVKLKLPKLCALSKVRLELLVKLFQSRLDSSVFDHGGKMQKEKTSKLPLKDRWPNTTSFSLFQSSCLNGCFWKFRGCFFVNFQKPLLLRFNLWFSKVFWSTEVAALFCKKVALKNFAIFTGKQLCWNLFLIKLQAFRSPGLQLY